MLLGAHFHSFVFAQVFGLYLVIMALIMASKAKYYRDLILRLDPYNPAIAICSSIFLLIGLSIVVVHNIWALEPRIIITILGWLIAIKSILWLSFPVGMFGFSKKLYLGPGYYLIALILFAVGILLLTKGFHFYIPDEHKAYTLF